MKFSLSKLAVLAGSFLLIGCSSISKQEREYKRSKISITLVDNRVIFHVSETVNGIRVIVISDENTDEVLWKVFPKSYKKNNIVYGSMTQFLEVRVV